MDSRSQEKLAGIVKKDLHELTAPDMVFLRARRGYLTSDQLEKFKSVLESHANVVVEVDATEEIALSYKELQARVAAMGFHAIGKTRETLLKIIADAK